MISITNKTKQKLPNLPWGKITATILGPDYDLSLVFIGDKRSYNLNHHWRGKDKPTNILAFPLDESNGEIFINITQAKKEAPKFNRNQSNHIGALLIHGLLHLKGYEHSSTMDEEEEALRKLFKLNGQKYFNRNRHRHLLDQGGRM